MVSHPLEVGDGGVELLLKYWGGEAIYFWQQDMTLREKLKGIGRPRVLEIAMPLIHSNHSYSASKAVVATYARSLGCDSESNAFDLYTTHALGPEHVVSVHTEGDPNYLAMAQGYPTRFVDVDVSRWTAP